MNKKHQETPSRWLTKRSVIIAATVLAMGLLLFFLRYPLITAYANVFYKPGVAKQFDQAFAPLSAKLHELGFAFTGQPPSYNLQQCQPNRLGGGTIACIKDQTSIQKPFTPGEEFINNWRQHSPSLETYLLDNGWHKTGNVQRPIEDIYNNPDSQLSVAVHYAKTQGNIHCNLMIDYSGPSPYIRDSLSFTRASESCKRIITFPDVPRRADH